MAVGGHLIKVALFAVSVRGQVEVPRPLCILAIARVVAWQLLAENN